MSIERLELAGVLLVAWAVTYLAIGAVVGDRWSQPIPTSWWLHASWRYGIATVLVFGLFEAGAMAGLWKVPPGP